MTRSRRKKQATTISPQMTNALAIWSRGMLPPGSEQLRDELERLRDSAIQQATNGEGAESLTLLDALQIDSVIRWHCAGQLALRMLGEDWERLPADSRLTFIEKFAKFGDKRADAAAKCEKIRRLLAGEKEVSGTLAIVAEFYREDQEAEDAAAEAYQLAGEVDEIEALASDPAYQGKTPQEIIDSCIPPVGSYAEPPAPDPSGIASLRRAPTSMLLSHMGLQDAHDDAHDNEQAPDSATDPTPARAPSGSVFDRFGGLPDHHAGSHDAGDDDSAPPAGQSLFALFGSPAAT